MKKINISKTSRRLDENSLCRIAGGANCQCGCLYEGQPGGSTTAANNSANTAGGLHSTTCPVDRIEYPAPDIPISPQSSICVNHASCWV